MDEIELSRQLPEVEDCSHGFVPSNTETSDRKIRIADGLVSMPKFFFRKYRKKLYEYLNACLRDGSLRAAVKFPFLNISVNPSVCEFSGWEFWRVDQRTFLMDIYFTLTLSDESGRRPWKGCLELLCSFANQNFTFSILCLSAADEAPDHTGAIRLSPFLIPYFHGDEIDSECEKIWTLHNPAALMDPEARDAEALAGKYGLKIEYLPVYSDQGILSILFLAEGELLTRDDPIYPLRAPWEKAVRDQEKQPPETVQIPAGTIVVNTNRIHRKNASFCVYHEVIHYEYHYLFFRLQQLGNNDTRALKTREIILKPDERITDPVYWMEKQASRGAYGLMLPITWMRGVVSRACASVQEYRHAGELFELAGRKICAKYRFANYQMRARLIQMGFIAAKGSLNWLPGRLHVQPFAFDLDSCRRVEETFLIQKAEAGWLYETDENYRKIIDTGDFMYADGHIVRRGSRFVREEDHRYLLTPWANAHVDECCLRFVRVYTQRGIGRYIFGRMNYDEDYAAKTMFYLGLEGNREMLSEMEAEQQFADAFPATFAEGLKLLLRKAGISQEEMAERLHMEPRTFKRWLANEDKRYTEDFVMMAALILKLPDWITDLLLDRAGLTLSSKNPRHLALRWIQRAMWMDGVEKANEYLKKRDFKPLEI